MNISDVNYFKIHPAIGVTRIANNEDYFEFYEANANGFQPAEDYMSGGDNSDPDPGKLRLKRQAVKFSVYAYGEDGQVLGNVEDLFSDVRISWTANVANRKLYNYSEKGGGNLINPVTAEGTADSPGVETELNGVSPWDDTVAINLGTITGDGLFIPPKGGVTREYPDSTIDRYPANQSGAMQCTDTSCDGQISAIIDVDGSEVSQSIIPAWVIAAPGQHALKLTPVMAEAMMMDGGQFEPSGNNNINSDWLISTKSLLGINGTVYDPTGLDIPMMETMNADYNPGMELNIGDTGRMETGTNPADFFYARGTDYINENEIRVESQDGSSGALPGQLTSGLCSTWQGDMVLCLNYWTAENPNKAYGNDGDSEVVIYSEADPNQQMNDPEEINTEMDFRGIVDNEPGSGSNIKLNLVFDPNRPSQDA